MSKWIVAIMLVALLMVGCAKTETAENHGVFDTRGLENRRRQKDGRHVCCVGGCI